MIVLYAVVECGNCGELYEGEWEEDSDELGDMDGPPVADQVCPGCGSSQVEEWPGWTNHNLAGLQGSSYKVGVTGNGQGQQERTSGGAAPGEGTS